ncbi:MAG: hypothetical protein QG579_42 [Patescibacteria group bacterium]|nr:hypothetical protein [Patescibacteria group bacterium]
MKKALFAVLFILSLTSLASAKDSVLCTVVAPEGAMLERYPTSSGPLSVAQTADLGLHPVRLTEATEVLNHQRNRVGCAGGSWSAETLPAGTLVLVDKDGVLRYKQDCGNRLVVVPAKAQATIVPPVPPAKGGGDADATPPASGEDGGWMGWWTPGGLLRDIIMFLLGLSLLIAVGLVLWWLLLHLLDWLREHAPIRPVGPAPAPVAPVVSPTLVAPPVVVGPAPGPVPVRTIRRFGPFMAVNVTDMGADGFRVVADGHYLGTFNPSHTVSTEDAGPAGHYVVVTT